MEIWRLKTKDTVDQLKLGKNNLKQSAQINATGNTKKKNTKMLFGDNIVHSIKM